MVFSYYHRLSVAHKRVYRASDAIHGVMVPDIDQLHPLIPRLEYALGKEDRETVEEICTEIVAGITKRLIIPQVLVTVLAVRPSASWGELHGLYEPISDRRSLAVITLWMRTAKQKRVVAFKAFLRTLLHEFGHHLDYEHFKLVDSFHTEGFYKRESSLFQQLVPIASNIK